MARFPRRAAAVGLLAVVAAGCGGDPTGTLAGTVTLDGKPLAAGSVRLVPADGRPPVGGIVTDGTFTLAAPVGDARVEFSAAKVVGKKKMYDTPDSPVVEETAEVLPARYNIQSELKLTVKGGRQEVTFDLKSK
jgi:hypothetical protein